MLPGIKDGDRLEVLQLDEKTRTQLARGNIVLVLIASGTAAMD